MPPSECDVLNLGCGEKAPGEWWNVDISPEVQPDEVVNLNEYPWPWEDSSWELVRAEHVLEHLREPMGAMSEIERITEPGGTLILRYPIGHTRFEDPTHRHFWNYNTAAWLAGDGKHSHENGVRLSLVHQDVNWHASGLASIYARVRSALGGNGPWLSQVPSLGGEVRATYEVGV